MDMQIYDYVILSTIIKNIMYYVEVLLVDPFVYRLTEWGVRVVSLTRLIWLLCS